MIAAAADAALVQAARDGDRAAFEALMHRHLDAVYGHALRFFGDRSTAEDAAQEVFLRVYRSLGDFDGRSSFTTWLYRVTRNVCVDMFRRGRRQPTPVDPLDLPQHSSSDFSDDVVLAAALEKAIAALQPEERDAFNAVALFDLSYQAAGEALGIPTGTVKSRVHRARRSLIFSLGLDGREQT